jgi:hypothetical protein
MNRFEWDGLRPGDVVHAHDAGEPGPARRGTVVFLTVRVRQPNEVGIELDDGHRVVWPAPRTVHVDRVAQVGTCWRCADIDRRVPATA